MIKLPYILEYSLFEKIDLHVAEELLAEYNDFMGYNKTNVFKAGATIDITSEEVIPQETEEQLRDRLEHNRQVALDHFEKLFGDKDIPESTLVGMKIDYDAVQKVLLDERANKVPITESAFNQIAPTIRAAASALLIAERVVSGLYKLYGTVKDKEREKCWLAIDFAREGFELLLDGISKGSFQIPEYHKIRKEMHKYKTVKAYIDFCEKLFFDNRDY